MVQARALTGSALLLGLAWTCSPASGAAEGAVVASIKPVHSLVAGVMQGVGEPALLVKGASSPHSYSLRPSDARALEEARVVFWIGEGLETYLAKPLQALAATALVVPLSEAEGVRLLPARAGGVWAGEGRTAAMPAEDAGGAEGEHGHGHGRFDSHIWLDPRNAEAMVDAIVTTLSEADPANASVYRANGKELRGRLEELDQTLSTQLAPVRDRPFVVFHDAYQYLEERYGLNALGTISVDPGRRPGARRLAAIRRELAELDAACVFAEPQFEPALVESVIESTNARKGVLDPLGADLEAGPEQYFQLMSGLARSLLECLEEPGNSTHVEGER
ncbi:MAG TPA: zinc ABC transporter substrate-binding protein [Geminicoccaceae bacterium]|nr:zinc ABC transporter substrate-binding protein [Geminicoccaceae bacterium]